ncbi:MAG TPA: efflux RND transporter periplasmic adaptor subunit [Anaerolineales bacterium]|nr:efflux RND transporter periplasmic adaptor subunit [Anaerolineales bacterium]
MKRLLTIIIILAVVGVIAFFGITALRQRQQEATLSDLQTVVASRGSLTATIGATGMVHANQTAVLTWQTSGNVEQISVATGDTVSADQVLATLQTSSLSQNIILAQADLISAQRALDDLLNDTTSPVQALQAVYSAQQGIRAAERAMDRFEGDEYKDALDEARQNVIDRGDELEAAQEAFEPYEDWDASNETRQDYEQELIDAQNAYDEAVRTVDLLELEAEVAQANLDAANAALAAAQRVYDRVKDGPNADDVTVLESRIAAAQAALDLTQLTAPFAATVTEVNLKPADRVTPGTLAIRLDDLSRLVVDVQVSEVDINRIQTGQAANLTFDAILDKEYHGTVAEVAQVGSVVQGIVQFNVSVELTDADEDVRPGMTAGVNIIVEQRDNVLLVPNRAVRLVDGQRVVYILQDEQLEMVEITLGASSDTESEVVDGGLQSGDLIVLNPPQNYEAGGPPFMGG